MTPMRYINPPFNIDDYRRSKDDIFIKCFCDELECGIRFLTPEGTSYDVRAPEHDSACDFNPQSQPFEAIKTMSENQTPDLPYPVKNILLSTKCMFFSIVGEYADGKGGSYLSPISLYDPTCRNSAVRTVVVSGFIKNLRQKAANVLYFLADIIAVNPRISREAAESFIKAAASEGYSVGAAIEKANAAKSE